MVSLKSVFLLDNLYQKQQHFILNFWWGSSKPQRTKGVRVNKRERERESEFGVEHK